MITGKIPIGVGSRPVATAKMRNSLIIFCRKVTNYSIDFSTFVIRYLQSDTIDCLDFNYV